MILYFSSTGNCKYTAEKIAESTLDWAMSLSEACQNGDYGILPEQGEPLGLVLPTYFGCLHVCPENAIAYTKATIGHGQYYNPKTTR